jgi:hypothetical protein
MHPNTGMFRPISRAGAWAVLVCATVGPVAAQWLNQPDPRTPRTADGRPNLSGPAPKLPDGKADLSGIWQVDDNRLQFNLMLDGPEVPMLPAAAALYKQRLAGLGKDRPSGHCLPHSVPDAMLIPEPFKIVHHPGVTFILFEEFVQFRQVFTDGRALPKNPQPIWFGYSVGRWEGDSFVIESSGFNDKSWIDDDGHPHTDALHTTERFRRSDFGHMTMQITIDDPKAYTKPWSALLHYTLMPDTELIEFVCDNEKDAPHLVGK